MKRVTGRDEHLGHAYRGRTSPQRRAVASAADAMCSVFSAEDLVRAVRASGVAVGTATVYRAVIAMEDAGFIEPVGARDGAVVYARCRAEGHHHHLVCESCGTVEEADCDLGDAVSRAEAASGFTVTRHEFTLHGLCGRCAAREGTA